MKKFSILLILFFFSLANAFAAPTLPDKCIVFYPDVLLSSPILKDTDMKAFMKTPDFGQRREPKDRRFWIVYSDRDDNPTYAMPDGATRYKSLTMNERLRIAQIKNGYALVYVEPQADIAYPKISQYAECKGWVPMKNLLLWHSCPADEAGIYYKALLCVNLDRNADSNLGNLYRNPKNKSKYEKLATDMRFYFVMKREGNLALLSVAHSLDGRSDQVLYGWVDEQSFVAWNQRSCLEPTWDIKDVEYFADEKVQASIYKEADLDQCITRIKFERKQSTKYDKHLYRMNPDQLRFPLLDYKSDDLYHCSTFSSSGGGMATVSTAQSSEKSDLGYSEAELRELTNINIGIVIDGTTSMAPFYPAVKEAIKEGCKFFGKKYNVKVGTVIYRDYSDGQYLTEVFPLTRPDNPALGTFLDTGGEYGVKSHKADKTIAEAMYSGIDTALDRLGFRNNQSNILLVVGDCGNDRADTKITDASLIQKLVEKNVCIMGFQVRRNSEDAYELFNSQLLNLMRSSLEKKYAKLKDGVKMQLKEVKDGYALLNDAKSTIYVGTHNFPELGQQVEVSKLSGLMLDAIRLCSESVAHKIDIWTSLNAGGFKTSTSSVNTDIDIDEAWLRHKLGDRFEKIKESNSLLAFKGFVHKSHKSGRGFFKPVVFISSDELNSLIERLAPVNDAAVAQTNDREPYVRAMKALIQSMLPELSDDEMNRMGYKEVMGLVAGLNEASNALKGYSIAEIASHQAVSHTEYVKLVSDFKRKFSLLTRLKANPYKYTRTFNGLKYYWLPVEDLP